MNSVEEHKEPIEAVIFTDGASRGNPGESGAGAVIYHGRGKTLLKKYLGVTTNNAAEYHALLMALKSAEEAGFRRVRVFTDSRLMASQVRGDWDVNDVKLMELHRSVTKRVQKLRVFEITSLPRELNREADRLANEAIDDVKAL